ncbi:MAG: restriction endonuclease subunit S [Burkholderiaceae bacterium]|nr:restriction endonuclease subunit S [Burkholderiaceae bacterium]
MRSEVRRVKLASLAAPVSNAIAAGPFGSNLVSRDYVEFGVPVIRGQNLSGRWVAGEFVFVTATKAEQLRSNTAKPGDIVFTQRGTLGQVSVVPATPFGLYVVSQSQMKLTVDHSAADPRYVYYACTAPDFITQVHNNAVAAGVPHINLGILRGLEIPFPPMPMQAMAADVLAALDDRIDLLRQTNATLESIARALFKSWFIDFDPVRAKAEGREPEGMDAATAALFPSEFEESALGLIPKGWCTGDIYKVADVRYGAPFSSKLFNAEGGGLPLVRIRDLKDEAPGVWTPETHPKGCKIQPGDIVVGMDGEFRAYLWGGEVAWMNQRICMFIPKNGHSAAFVRSAIASPLAHVEATETATTVIHLGKADIDRFRIVIPTQEVGRAFGAVAQPLYDRIVASKQTMRSLSSVRDTLLPRLISGKLRLPEAQAQLEEAIA